MQQLHVSTLGNKWYLYLNSLCFEMYITKLRYLVTSCSFLCFCLDVISDLRLSIQKWATRYTEDGVSLHYCVLFVKLWKWEVHVYILINSFVHDVEFITVWTLRIHFVCVICMYMCVLLYSRCFLKIIFKSAAWTYCVYWEIFTLILFFSPLWLSLSAGLFKT